MGRGLSIRIHRQLRVAAGSERAMLTGARTGDRQSRTSPSPSARSGMRSMRRKSILLMSVMRVVDVSPFGKGDVPGQLVGEGPATSQQLWLQGRIHLSISQKV